MSDKQVYDFADLCRIYGRTRRTVSRWLKSDKHPQHDYWGDNGKKLWRASKINRYRERMK